MPKNILDDFTKLASSDAVSASELVNAIIREMGGVDAAAQLVASELMDEKSKANKVNAMVSLIRVLDKDAPKDVVGLPDMSEESLEEILDASAAARSGHGYE